MLIISKDRVFFEIRPYFTISGTKLISDMKLILYLFRVCVLELRSNIVVGSNPTGSQKLIFQNFILIKNFNQILILNKEN